MAIIGTINNQGTIQGQINDAHGVVTGVISNASQLGGEVVGMRGFKGDKGDQGDPGTPGADGSPGADGHSPVVTASKTGSTTTVYVDGTSIATIDDGTDGQDGADGFSPSASVSKAGSTTTITITDKGGTTTATIDDGEQNVQSDWNEADNTADDYIKNKPSIHNVPSGGTSGQVLSKSSATDYDVGWTTPSAGGGEVVYCECTDSASTVAKTATVVTGSFSSLSTGAQVAVKFTYTNTATDPTLNVNNTGAKAIMRGGTAHVGTNTNESWGAGTVVYMLYDGSTWNIVGWLNTTYTGGTEYEIVAGTVALNKVWSPQQIHNGIDGMATDTPTASKNAKFDSSAHMNSKDMTTGSGGEVEDFVDSLNYSGIHAVDYVVEQGTNNDWTYRKWNSGDYDAWQKKSLNIAANSSFGALYYSAEQTLNLPSFQISGDTMQYQISGSTNGTNFLIFQAFRSAGDYVSFRLVSVTSQSATGRVASFILHGRWK